MASQDQPWARALLDLQGLELVGEPAQGGDRAQPDGRVLAGRLLGDVRCGGHARQHTLTRGVCQLPLTSPSRRPTSPAIMQFWSRVGGASLPGRGPGRRYVRTRTGVRTTTTGRYGVRVLGVDPGLTRCGLGVVEGASRAAADAGRGRRGPHAADRRHRRPAAGHRARDRGVARPSTGRTRSPSSGCSASTTCAPSWAPPRPARSRSSAAARAGIPVALHTPSEMKAAVTGSGRADKAQVGAMVTRILRLTTRPEAGRRRRRARPGDLPRLARRRAGPAPRPRRRAAAAGARPMIAFVAGRVAALAPDGAVVEVGGVGLSVQCTPGTLAGAAHRRAGPPADRAGRPRGLADALRLRRRGRAGGVRAAADRERGRPAAGPGDARRARPRRAAPRGGHRGPRGADAGPGIGRKGAQRIVLELKDRLGAVRGVSAPRRVAAAGPTPAGATRCTPRCSASAGPAARPTRP